MSARDLEGEETGNGSKPTFDWKTRPFGVDDLHPEVLHVVGDILSNSTHADDTEL